MGDSFYSFVVFAPEEVLLEEYFVHLDRGRNVFNVRVQDIAAFKSELAARHVRITMMNCLDDEEVKERLTLGRSVQPAPFETR